MDWANILEMWALCFVCWVIGYRAGVYCARRKLQEKKEG